MKIKHLAAVLLGFTIYFSSKTTAWIDADEVKFREGNCVGTFCWSDHFTFYKHHAVMIERANVPYEIHSWDSIEAVYDLIRIDT